MTYTAHVGPRLLTEWKFEAYGWLYAVGYIRPQGTGPRAERLARQVLDTWEWIPPGAGVAPPDART